MQRVDGQYEEEEENAHLEADAQYAYTSSYPKVRRDLFRFKVHVLILP